MKRILIDTNVLLYSIDEDSKYFNDVNDILTKSDLNFFTSSKNLSEF